MHKGNGLEQGEALRHLFQRILEVTRKHKKDEETLLADCPFVSEGGAVLFDGALVKEVIEKLVELETHCLRNLGSA